MAIYQHLFDSFSPSYKRLEEKGNYVVKDKTHKRKVHGAVDEPSSEQQFCKLDVITFLV